MKTKTMKRLLAWIMAIIMVLDMVPMQVFATNADDHTGHDHEIITEAIVADDDSVVDSPEDSQQSEEVIPPEENTPPAEPSPADKIRGELAAYIEKYGLTPDMPDSVLADVYMKLGGEGAMEAWYKADEIYQTGMGLPQADKDVLSAEQNSKLFIRFYETMIKVNSPAIIAVGDTYKPVEGVEVTVNSATSDSMADGVITVTAQGKAGSGCSSGSSAKAELAIKAVGTLSFTVGQSNVNKLAITLNGSAYTLTDGKFGPEELDADDVLTITVTTGENNTVNTLTLSGFEYKKSEAKYNVTVDYNSTAGSVTADGNAVADGAVIGNVTGDQGVALSATAASGYTFYGWVDVTNKVISQDASFTLKPSADITIKPVFGKDGDAGVYVVGDAVTQTGAQLEYYMGTEYTYHNATCEFLFNDFNSAVAKAESTNHKYIVLLNNAALPAGTYTVPAGKVFVIPMDASHTFFTTAPMYVDAPSGKHPEMPYEFRRLTLTNGANLVVNGSVSVSARHEVANGGQTDAGVAGAYARIEVSEGSSLTVNSGGTLYAWGYITGSGNVYAKSGSTIYEYFQVTDYRGGSATSDMDNEVFPFQQYYVQNIEAALTLEAGAVEKGYTSIYAGARWSTAFDFISNGKSLFKLEEGYLIKKYDGTKDRLVLDLHGKVSMSPVTISMGLGSGSTGVSINSEDYVLPITNNITVNVKNGAEVYISQSIALLPGAEINIDAGGICTVEKAGEGKSPNRMYAYDSEQWSNYIGTPNAKFIPLRYSPTRTYTRTEADLVDAVVKINGIFDASLGYVYTTASGSNIYSDGEGQLITGEAGSHTLHQVRYINKANEFTEISITPAQLKNGDGSFVKTAEAGKGGYIYKRGSWHTPECGAKYIGVYVSEADAPTCTEKGTLTYTCKCTDDSYTEEAAALGHTESTKNGEKIDPTCTEAGGQYVITYCTVCNEELGQELTDEKAALGHTTEGVEAVVENKVDATCTEDGSYDEVFYCPVCGDEYDRFYYTINATGHNADGETKTTVTKAPTCTETGIETTTTLCTKCGQPNPDYTKEATVPALGHTDGEPVVTTVDPTCTEAGSKRTVVTCTVCQTVTKDKTDTLPALGHNAAGFINAKAPTCTDEGWNAYTFCTICDLPTDIVDGVATVIAKPTIAANGHTAGTAKIENEKAATCYAEGSYDEAVYCTVRNCGAELSRVTKTTDKIPHTPAQAVRENEVAATCYAEGSYEEVVRCSVEECKYEISRTEKTTEKTPHTPAQAVRENEVAATCYAEGSYEEVVRCSVEECKYEISRTEKTTDKIPHTPAQAVRENEVAATCYAEGSYDEVVYCSVEECKEKLDTTAKTIDKLPHTEGEAVRENVVDAKCDIPGSYDEVVYCSVAECKEELSRTPATINAPGHAWDNGVIKEGHEASCIKEGTKTYTCANDANHTYTENIGFGGHTAGEPTQENVKAATCYAEGSYDEVVTCTLCYTEISRETKTIGKLDHTPGTAEQENVVASTCYEKGSYDEVVYCSVAKCHAELSREVKEIPEIAHTPREAVKENEVAPKCEETGSYDEVVYCSVAECKKELSRTPVTVDATDHDWDEGVILAGDEPTCTEKGTKTFTCKNDASHTYTAVVDELGHTDGEAVKENIVDAKCYEKGSYDEVVYCTVCDAELSREEKEIPEIDHTPREAVKENEVAPDCVTEGSYDMVIYCSVAECGAELDRETFTVDALGHTWDNGRVTTAPGCETKGEKVFECTVDGCNGSKTVELDPTGHSWQYVTTTEPTCTEEGKADSAYCPNCLEFKTVEAGDIITIPALGHNFSYSKVVRPTCTSEGYIEMFCNRAGCGVEEKVTIDMLEHNIVVDAAVEATCTSTGLTAGSHCSVCNTVLEKQTETEKVPHTEVTVPGYDAECDKPGKKDGIQCSVCNTWIKEQEEITAPGHTEVKDEAVAATCTTAGLTEGIHCDVCGTVIKEQTTVPATGHTKGETVKENEVDVTCTTDGGYDEVVYCSVENCGAELSRKSYVITAKGHKEAPAVKENEVAAGCETDGSYDLAVYCSVCSSELSREEVTVDRLGHTWDEGTIKIAPSCTQMGVIEYKCNCGKTSGGTIAMLTHVAGEAVKENEVAAGCTNPGSYDSVEYCTSCNKELSREKVSIPATGHNNIVAKETGRTEATCTQGGGYTLSIYCEDCGTQMSVYDIVTNAKGHAGKDAVKENEVAAGCTTDGSYESVVYCAVCGEEISRETVAVDAAGHTPLEAVEENRIESTCTEEGSYDMVVYCDVCDTELDRDTFSISATDHDWDEGKVTTESTCSAEGVKTFTCKNDETHTYTEKVEKLPHTEETIPAVEETCTEEGWTTGVKCSVCDAILEEPEVVPELGHNYVTDKAVDPTCTETGLTAGSHCDRCGDVALAQKVVAAKGHTETALPAVDPTCTETGLTAGVKCSVCDEILTAQEEIPALGHTEGTIPGTPAVCQKPGKTEGVKCTVCGTILVPQEDIEAPGHTWVTDKAVDPTCTETGLTEGSHCDVCGTVWEQQKTVPAKGHKAEIDAAVAATCTETGLTKGSHCSVCSEVLVAQEEIPALGHTETEIPAVDPTCTETGLTEGVKCSVCDEVLTEQEEVPELGHEWGTGRITTEPKCEEEGERTFTCSVCREEKTETEPELGHALETVPAKAPSFTAAGWEEYERCTNEDCFYNTKVEIPALGEPTITSFDEFIYNLGILESLANEYKKINYSKLSAEELVIRYIRTGVDRYNSFSWQAMAGSKDENFEKFVTDFENAQNAGVEKREDMMIVTGLKNLTEFTLPNGDKADVGHIFGTLDISITNKNSQDHADVAGWAGDTVDLLTAADNCHIDATGKTVEELVDEIREKIFLKESGYLIQTYNPMLNVDGELEGSFSQCDIDGDLDGYYIFNELMSREYTEGTLTALFANYMTPSLTNEKRAEYFLKNRLGGVTLRSDVREAVYNAYIANTDVLMTLENTRVFENSPENILTMRRATCYVVADYLCKWGGDYMDIAANPYIEVIQTTTTELAPGVTQKISKANTADGKQMDFYIAYADVTRGDVSVHANYGKNDPYISYGKTYDQVEWALTRVLDQANYAQERHSDPTTENYVPNYNVVAATNGTGFNMYTGEPSELLVMEGVEVHGLGKGVVYDSDFFGVLKDGRAIIGTGSEYNELMEKGELMEAVSSFGTRLVKDGKIQVTATSNYYTDRASRTAIGVTKTGKVVMLVIDGRQGELSCGASAIEIAQIMLDAGCWQAVNLDGGGSSTYVSKQPGTDKLDVTNFPSDGIARSVASSIFVVSTAPSSTEFDHAVVNSDYNYVTIGSTAQFSAKAVSATGNAVDMPEGVEWVVSDEAIGTITADGVFTATANGETKVNLMLDGEVIGSKTINVVVPNNIYFTKDNINAIYGKETVLPIKAVYNGKDVSANENDITIKLENASAGTVNGFVVIANEASGLRKVKATASLVNNPEVTASMTLSLFREDEVSFDFENAAGGDAQLAWEREVSNSTYQGNNVYMVKDPNEDMVTSYTFGIDMSKIEIPPKLKDLTYMLPGADLEDASAWKFLLQLAERISNLTNVEAKMKFDADLDVDISEISVSNEYFEFNSAEYNPETNEVSIKMTWIDQVKPIDEGTANPMCIVTGIKLTPKEDASWTANDTLSIINSGTISYDIYLGTSTLYSFSCKEENQEIFGLFPYENLSDTEHPRGGHFMDTYKTFDDSYTLIKTVKEGWVIEEGGFAYYEDGNRYTGIRLVPDGKGLYYDFGENGINKGQNPYEGFMTENGDEFYLLKGVKQSGWFIFTMTDVRYYNPETFAREELIADEVPSTCIIDGYCDYTSESGATKHIAYDDAGGHDWAVQQDGSRICKKCGHERVEMEQAEVILSYYECTYTGAARTPSTTVIAKDGTILAKPPAEFPDYSSKYSNNIEVGTASVTMTAAKYGKYGNLNDWYGNAAGSVTVTYEIRPDVPATIIITKDGDNAVMSWTQAKAPEVTYVLYKSTDGENWTEFAATTELSYTLNPAEHEGEVFRLGTRKVVDGKTYDSLTLSQTRRMNITVTAGHNEETGKPTLKWTTMLGADKYFVYRSTNENGPFTKVFETGGTTYTHSSAKAGVTYYYYVVAQFDEDKDGVYEATSLESNVVENKSNETIPGPVEPAELVVTAANNADGYPRITWEKYENAVSYEVYRADAENGEFVKMFTTKGTTYTNTSAQTGKTYWYKVRAILADGTDVYSKTAAGTSEQAFEITAKNNDAGKPTLKWNVPAGVASFEVYRAESENGKFVKMFTTKGTTYTNTSALIGETYYYKVKVIFKDGTEKYSNTVSNYSKQEFTVTAGHNAKGQPTLKWTTVTGAKSYEVYRSESATGKFVKMFTTNGLTYTNSGAKAGVTYYYKVKATLVDGSEVYTEVVANAVKASADKLAVTIGNNAKGLPTLEWGAVNGAQSYEVLRATSKNGIYVKVFTTTGRTYTHSSATEGNTYWYKVRAVLADGKTVISSEVSNTYIQPKVLMVNPAVLSVFTY